MTNTERSDVVTVSGSRRVGRKIGTVAALVIAAAFVTGTASAAELAPSKPTRLGPYEYLSTCLHVGNKGMVSGRWEDYDCRKSHGRTYLYPRY
jgi:hypothetical protein